MQNPSNGRPRERPEAEVGEGKLSVSSKRRLINGCYTKNAHVKDKNITQSPGLILLMSDITNVIYRKLDRIKI